MQHLVLPSGAVTLQLVHILFIGSLKPCVSSCGSYRFLCPQALLQRRKTFRAGLEQVTRQHHKEYLRQLGIEVADPELKRWHPDFPLHEVDDVPASPLPAAPKGEKLVSAQEVLARLQDKTGVDVEGTVPPVMPAPAPENGALKGVSVNLIEKVCAAISASLWSVLLQRAVSARAGEAA